MEMHCDLGTGKKPELEIEAFQKLTQEADLVHIARLKSLLAFWQHIQPVIGLRYRLPICTH